MQLAPYRTAGSSHLQLHVTDCNIQHPCSAMQYNTHNKTHTLFATVSMLLFWYVTHIKKQIQSTGKNLLFTQKGCVGIFNKFQHNTESFLYLVCSLGLADLIPLFSL